MIDDTQELIGLKDLESNVPHYYKEFGWLATANIVFLILVVLIILAAWKYITNNVTNKLGVIIFNQTQYIKDDSDREARLIDKINEHHNLTMDAISKQNEKTATLLAGVNIMVSKNLLGKKDDSKT